jgi:hypothetical protein
MSRNLLYSTGLIGASLIITLLYIWSIQHDAKHDTAQTGNPPYMQDIAVSIDDTANSLNARLESLESLQQQFTAEQVKLREQLETLQTSLQNYIEESNAAQSDASMATSTSTDEFLGSYQEPMTAQALSTLIAQADFTQEEAITSLLNAEEADPDWSDQAEAEIRAAFETDGNLNAQLVNIECRSTYCRVEGIFGDTEARDRSISQLMSLMPWKTQAFYHGDEQEGVTGSVYVLRDSVTELPRIE